MGLAERIAYTEGARIFYLNEVSDYNFHYFYQKLKLPQTSLGKTLPLKTFIQGPFLISVLTLPPMPPCCMKMSVKK